MATEVELFEYQDIANRPSIRGYVDANGAAQLALGAYTAARFITVNGIQYLVDGGGKPFMGVVAAGVGYRSMQDAMNAGKLQIQQGAGTLAEPLLIGSGMTISADAGAVITNSGTYQHNMLRTGNADYLGGQDSIPGVYVLCADERETYTEGTLTYTHAGTMLTWQVNGEAAGTPVSIAGVVSTATGGIFEVPGATSSIYVVVVVAAARNTTRSRSVRVEPITGMRPMTWSRAANVLTVTEPNHRRRVGDPVQLWGASVRRHLYVASTQPGSWTAVDARSSGSGTGKAYGVNGVTLNLSGSLWDQARGVVGTAQTGLCDIVFCMFLLGGVTIAAPTFTRCTKYAVHLTGVSNVTGSGLRITGEASTNNDGLHIAGPSRGGSWNGISGSAGDNLAAMGCCDYVQYNIFWPSEGVVDVESWTLSGLQGDGALFELFRIYNANSGWVRNITVDGISGTVAAGTSAIASIVTDGNASQVDAGATNVDGLTIRNVSAARADGSQMPTYSVSGAGTHRNIRFEDVIPQVCGAVSGTIQVTTGLEDLTVTLKESQQAFAGALLALTSASSRIKKLTVAGNGRIRADNQAPVTLGNGSAATPILVSLSNVAAQVDSMDMGNVTLEDISTVGNKARVVDNAGIFGSAQFRFLNATGIDAVWRQNSGANVSTRVVADGCDTAGTYFMATDAAVAVTSFSGCRISGHAMHLGGSGAYRVDATNTVFNNTFLRPAANSPVITASAVGCTAVAPLTVLGGTPTVRLGGAFSMSLDGTLLDATVANHAPGASFYNTAGGFGAGVGAYVRGVTTWTRVAA